MGKTFGLEAAEKKSLTYKTVDLFYAKPKKKYIHSAVSISS